MPADQNNDQTTHVVKVERMHDKDAHGEHKLYVKLPNELMKQLQWELGDDVVWEGFWRTITMGLTLSNRSQQFRDAEEALRKAISIDME